MPHTIVLVQYSAGAPCFLACSATARSCCSCCLLTYLPLPVCVADRTKRTYYDYENEGAAFDGACRCRHKLTARSTALVSPPSLRCARAPLGVVKLYEAKLKQLNPQVRQITYDISDLFSYIDSLGDLSALV